MANGSLCPIRSKKNEGRPAGAAACSAFLRVYDRTIRPGGEDGDVEPQCSICTVLALSVEYGDHTIALGKQRLPVGDDPLALGRQGILLAEHPTRQESIEQAPVKIMHTSKTGFTRISSAK
jgi:hypothetical protein